MGPSRLEQASQMFTPRVGGWSGIAAKDIGACAFGILKAGELAAWYQGL